MMPLKIFLQELSLKCLIILFRNAKLYTIIFFFCLLEPQVVVPPLPGKALLRQFPFRGDDGIFDENFIEERRQGLEQFLNK